MKTIKAWWSRGPSPGNMGDILTPILLKKLGINATCCSRRRSEKLMGIGSTAKFIKPNDIVWGTGIMRDSDPIEKNAQYLAVRGPLTGRKVGCKVYGDAGLLTGKLFPYDGKCQEATAIVPHYVDRGIEAGGLHEIDIINGDPIKVAHEIASYGKIISTSLHGIIIAHSYGVPAAWWKPTDKLNGDGSKFEDYALSVGINLKPESDINKVVWTLPDPKVIDSIQNKLINVIQDHKLLF